MKKFPLVMIFLTTTFFAHAQNVGIGTINPLARLHVTDSAVLFSAAGNVSPTPGLPPLQGAGRRMMWYPAKAAFRAGWAFDTEWDMSNIGNYSVAMGESNKASGVGSFAMGHFSTGSGDYSLAIGYVATASGYLSTSIGSSAVASGSGAMSLGNSTTASGASSTVIGAYGSAAADFSIAIGEDVTANSYISMSLGRQNDPIVASPTTSWVLTEPLLIVGNGTGSADKKNALAIAKNGNIYIDPSNKNDGTLSGNTLLFGTFNGAGEGISSKRTAGGNHFGLDFYTSSANRMSITNGGNVGIGTSNPQKNLSVQNGMNVDQADINNGSVVNAITFGINSGEGIGSKRNPGGNQWGLDFYTGGANRMSITNSGNVGIGTTSPAAKLQISAGDASVALFGPNSYGGQLAIGATPINQTSSTTAQVVASDGNLHIDPASGKNIYVGYYQARDIYLDPNGGNVGIGSTTPAGTLDVRGTSTTTGNFVNTSASSGAVGLQSTCNNIANGYGIISIGGQTGVLGQATAGGAGQRYGVIGIAGGNGSLAYGIYGSGSGGATSVYSGYFAGDVYSVGNYFGSDRKLKSDIKPLSDALSIIDQLKPSVYTFRTREYKQMNLPEGLQYGLIADEVKQVLPGAVKKTIQPAEYENHDERNGKKLSDEVEFDAVNYTEMIPILIGAIKEQQAIIISLQKQIDELKKPVKQ